MQQSFSDTKFMSEKEKRQVANAWERFIKSGFRFEKFTKALYNHLHMHCGHIAHNDRLGFYEAQLSTPELRTAFVDGLLEDHRSGRLYWGAYTDYKDLGDAMFGYVEDNIGKIDGLTLTARTDEYRGW